MDLSREMLHDDVGNDSTPTQLNRNGLKKGLKSRRRKNIQNNDLNNQF